MLFFLPSSSLGLLCLLLLSVAEAAPGKNFRQLRQHILQLREKRALRDAYHRLTIMAKGPSRSPWESIIEGTVEQPLDHFNRKNPLTFHQRFWIFEGYWRRPDGPVFLYIGGESALSFLDVIAGHHVDMAKKYGALLVALEHRFYGESINHDGLEDHNLWFLSSQQALSDLATFHNFITQKYNFKPNHPWISFGGSYPGSLSAWFRLKFPHLVFAAVASSAPVRAQLDFTGYNQVVGASLMNPVVGGSQECLEAVAEGFSTIDSLVRVRELSRLAKDFISCKPLEGFNDVVLLVSNLAANFMTATQYNVEDSPWMNVRKLCGIMTNQNKGTTYQRLIAVNDLVLKHMDSHCQDNSHQDEVQLLQNTDFKMAQWAARQWVFQTCTEFGYYQTCEDASCPFSKLMNLKYDLDICKEVFNMSFNSTQQAVSFTNNYYGADHPKASRVLFVNGDIDPWHALSVLKNQSDSELAILINGTAHCDDMGSASPEDPFPLREAKRRISAQVGAWLRLARNMQ